MLPIYTYKTKPTAKTVRQWKHLNCKIHLLREGNLL